VKVISFKYFKIDIFDPGFLFANVKLKVKSLIR
jgi:hypothetical protein